MKLSALGDSANQNSINASFERLGRYQLSVLDEAGQTARLEFSVVDQDLIGGKPPPTF
ncbi:hypothetical protein JYG35_03990 [Pseudomonas rhodesiae]|uniref:hypothetical protein n=1 Tax=Pseudomonas rhodesiae TaxID=76760 RepID=UPI0015A541F4|nr:MULTISPECIES: hypothetical protein [Pseudomonas]QVN07848.1 hypothetical protein JYG35_03990 [Pseudomonas rhodesiae]